MALGDISWIEVRIPVEGIIGPFFTGFFVGTDMQLIHSSCL